MKKNPWLYSRMSETLPMDKPIEQVNTRPAPILTQLNQTLALGIQKQLNRAEINRAVDVRPPATALLSINSADRYNPYFGEYTNPLVTGPATSPADFTINIGQNLMNGNFTRIAVQQVQIMFTFPIICQRTNGFYINWQPGGTGAVTQYLVQLPVSTYGQFALSTNATALQTAIRAATGSSTFTVTIVHSSYLQFASANTDAFYFSRWTSTFNPASITLYEIFGFPISQQLATVQYGSSNLQYTVTPYIDIVCEQITGNQLLRDASTTTLAGRTLLQRMYIIPTALQQGNGNFLGTTNVSTLYPVPKQISWPANQPISGVLHFQLLDAQGQVLSCGAQTLDASGNLLPFNDINMGDWSMVLQVSEQ